MPDRSIQAPPYERADASSGLWVGVLAIVLTALMIYGAAYIATHYTIEIKRKAPETAEASE